jgi:hypothetical protein
MEKEVQIRQFQDPSLGCFSFGFGCSVAPEPREERRFYWTDGA